MALYYSFMKKVFNLFMCIISFLAVLSFVWVGNDPHMEFSNYRRWALMFFTAMSAVVLVIAVYSRAYNSGLEDMTKEFKRHIPHAMEEFQRNQYNAIVREAQQIAIDKLKKKRGQ